MSNSVVRCAALSSEPLVVDEILGQVEDDAAGGLVVFVGRVRDHDGGRGVVALEYSAHDTAEQRLREVCARIAAEYDVHALAAVHRTGRLSIGEAAVVVAVSASHRDEAFGASRALIDTLKAEVPIWKHQVFTDGDEEWVGAPHASSPPTA